MELSPDELAIQKKALAFAKKNRTLICRRLTDTNIYAPEQQPVSVFMSGSPGAGKTESSKELVSALTEDGGHVLRLDPDDLRDEFEDYNGNNSYLFQSAVITLVERAMDMIFKNSQSFLLDGTLASFRVADKNISRSLSRNRMVLVVFVYQRPELAWSFVQAREKAEGRRILPDHFVDQFFGSQQVIEQLKSKYGNRIQVDLLVKDNDGHTQSEFIDVSSLQPYLDPAYTLEVVREIVGASQHREMQND
ncbi:zeta toxin family protein [Enterovibrio norvegicus]|uniref:zeta toxin family protein n=1 Tax=Enterovibrio norvegicus TaxID=188144 RepID=UPI0024B1A586|nr:zeta toxin family protein [Enterovibrio norvegicus]